MVSFLLKLEVVLLVVILPIVRPGDDGTNHQTRGNDEKTKMKARASSMRFSNNRKQSQQQQQQQHSSMGSSLSGKACCAGKKDRSPNHSPTKPLSSFGLREQHHHHQQDRAEEQAGAAPVQMPDGYPPVQAAGPFQCMGTSGSRVDQSLRRIREERDRLCAQSVHYFQAAPATFRFAILLAKDGDIEEPMVSNGQADKDQRDTRGLVSGFDFSPAIDAINRLGGTIDGQHQLGEVLLKRDGGRQGQEILMLSQPEAESLLVQLEEVFTELYASIRRVWGADFEVARLGADWQWRALIYCLFSSDNDHVGALVSAFDRYVTSRQKPKDFILKDPSHSLSLVAALCHLESIVDRPADPRHVDQVVRRMGSFAPLRKSSASAASSSSTTTPTTMGGFEESDNGDESGRDKSPSIRTSSSQQAGKLL